MKPDYVMAVVAVLGLGGQLLSLFLFQRIRIGQLESEKRVLDAVRGEFVPREVYNLQYADHERRLCIVESRR